MILSRPSRHGGHCRATHLNMQTPHVRRCLRLTMPCPCAAQLGAEPYCPMYVVLYSSKNSQPICPYPPSAQLVRSEIGVSIVTDTSWKKTYKHTRWLCFLSGRFLLPLWGSCPTSCLLACVCVCVYSIPDALLCLFVLLNVNPNSVTSHAPTTRVNHTLLKSASVQSDHQPTACDSGPWHGQHRTPRANRSLLLYIDTAAILVHSTVHIPQPWIRGRPVAERKHFCRGNMVTVPILWAITVLLTYTIPGPLSRPYGVPRY